MPHHFESPSTRLALNHAKAAKALSISERTLTDWANDPALNMPRVRIGRRNLYPVAELQKWLADRVKLEGGAA